MGLNLYRTGTNTVAATFDLDSQELRWADGTIWTRHGAPLPASIALSEGDAGYSAYALFA